MILVEAAEAEMSSQAFLEVNMREHEKNYRGT